MLTFGNVFVFFKDFRKLYKRKERKHNMDKENSKPFKTLEARLKEHCIHVHTYM